MKNKRNYLAVLGIVILLSIGYMFPTLITMLEDRHLQSERKKYEIEEISLNNVEVDLTEKLLGIHDVLQEYENTAFQQSKDELSTEQGHEGKQVKEFLSTLDSNIEASFLKASTKMTLMNAEEKNIYSLWKYVLVDSDEKEYVFWFDLEAEKVLAFEIPFFTNETSKEECYKLIDTLREYYGYTEGDFTDNVSLLFKMKYEESAVCFSDKEKDEKVVLRLYRSGERLSFNKSPSWIAITDKSTEGN